MNKKTKMYIGVGVLAVAAYYFWNKSKTTPTTTSAATTEAKKLVGSDGRIFANGDGSQCGSVPCRKGETTSTGWSGGITLCVKPDGSHICRNKYNK